MAILHTRSSSFGYQEAGAGPAVILVHAGLSDRHLWRHQLHALSAQNRVVAYDWRGAGESADAVGEVAHHEDLLSIMDALHIDSAVLVGCSVGGAYAVDAALTAPDRVAGLALICSGLSGHAWPSQMLSEVKEQVHSAVPADRLRRYQTHTADSVDPADVRAMARAQLGYTMVGPERTSADLTPEVWEFAMARCEGVFSRMWNGPENSPRWIEPAAKGRLSEVVAPTLVLNGLSDVPYIQQVSKLLADGIAGAERIDLPNTGHLPPLERPDETSEILLDFLGRIGHR